MIYDFYDIEILCSFNYFDKYYLYIEPLNINKEWNFYNYNIYMSHLE